jgi:SAM-dependent methyltransferase
MSDQYADLARDYDWLLTQDIRDNVLLLRSFGDVLGPPGTLKVLDCACGIGWNAIDLARRGYDVSASDGSAAMIGQARANAGGVRVELDLRVCRWDALGTVWTARFDVVLCVGNSLVHANAGDGLIRALRGMRDVLKPGGRLALDTRDWESPQWSPGRHVEVRSRAEVRGGERAIAVRTWDIPVSRGDEYRTDIILIFEDAEGRLSHREHTICYRPFTRRVLEWALEAAGFARWDIAADGAWLNVVAS